MGNTGSPSLRRCVGAAALVCALLQTHAAPAAAPSPAVAGQWRTLRGAMPINPIHLALLHTRKVLIVAGSEGLKANHEADFSSAAVWDPFNDPEGQHIAVQSPPWDLFCNGMALLADGRALIVGGTEQFSPFYGESRATIFDPATQAFMPVEPMAHGRWYATATALADGRVITFSGTDRDTVNDGTEIYQPGRGWSLPARAPFMPPLYPWLHLLADGKLFYAGPTAKSHRFDPATSAWTLNVASSIYGRPRHAGTSVLLPMLPREGYAQRILALGGDDPATASAELIDLSQPQPQWRSLPPMSAPRIYPSAVLLPDGKIVVAGGSLHNRDLATATLNVDLFDPATQTFAAAAPLAFGRVYHSGALLLPDARVWMAGSNPTPHDYQQHMEIYSPPYLFSTASDGTVVMATRPALQSAPAVIGYGGTLRYLARTANGAGIGSMVLVRATSVTHSLNTEQRLIGLDFQATSQGLRFAGPPSANLAPPGWYMLFVLDRAGVPSVARFVRVALHPDNQPPRAQIATPAGNVAIHAGESVDFSARESDADGAIARRKWIFPGGDRGDSADLNAGAVSFPVPGKYTVSLTVVDDQGDDDPSPPTRTVVVTPP